MPVSSPRADQASYPTVPTDHTNEVEHRRSLADAVNFTIRRAVGNIAFSGTVSVSSSTTVNETHRGRIIRVTAAATITTPPAPTVGAPFFFTVKNEHSSAITIDGNGSETIDGSANISLPAGAIVTIATDNSNWFTGTIYQVDGNQIVIGSDAQGDILYHNGTAYTRLAAGTAGQFLQTQGSGANPQWANGIIQVSATQDGAVATGTTTIPVDDTIPQQTEGDEYMTLAFTPKSASSRLKIEVSFNGATNAVNTLAVALFRDSGADALAVSSETSGTNQTQIISFVHDMASPGTSATTFKVRAGAQSGTTTFNGSAGGRLYGGVMASSIVITEYL